MRAMGHSTFSTIECLDVAKTEDGVLAADGGVEAETLRDQEYAHLLESVSSLLLE